MSIRHSLLVLLRERPRYGYELKNEFEARTGDTWPLNIGQVYTTLDRLERDGLVAREGDDGEGHVVYAVTDAGWAEAGAWFGSPVERTNPPRNELAIKIALALTVPGVDVPAVIQTQRAASMRSLQDCTQARRAAGEHDVAWRLVLESLVFALEAEIRWLDHCEATLARTMRAGGARSGGAGAGGAGAGGARAASSAENPAGRDRAEAGR